MLQVKSTPFVLNYRLVNGQTEALDFHDLLFAHEPLHVHSPYPQFVSALVWYGMIPGPAKALHK